MSNISGIGISFTFGLGWGDDDRGSRGQGSSRNDRVQDNSTYDASRYFYYEKLTKKERKALRRQEREAEEAAKSAAAPGATEDKLSQSPESNDGKFTGGSLSSSPRPPSPQPPARPKVVFKPHPSPEETRF